MFLTRLLELRKTKGLTQNEVANLCHISQETYSLWENNNFIIPLKHLNTLCNYYDTSMDYVLKLSNNKNNNQITKIETLDKKEIGQRIKIFRANNKLTLRALAKELNTTSSTISAYETGKTLILTAFVYQICKNYHISSDWLCGKSHHMEIFSNNK